MSADVAWGHGGDDGGDDRPPTHHIPTGYGGCFVNRGTRKPNLGGKKAGGLHTRQETWNLGLKKITDDKGPVSIRFEWDDKKTLMPLGPGGAEGGDLGKDCGQLKEDKYMGEIIDLQNKKKDLDNVVYKMGQSTQTMHMLTKHQVFYDEAHKTVLGYQNPFYLAQARRKVHALYDGHTIMNTHDALFVPKSEETLILAEESRLKMLAKQNATDVI
ncbi:hypothetical protein Tco_0543930, partial [Tanacetum coccineum]